MSRKSAGARRGRLFEAIHPHAVDVQTHMCHDWMITSIKVVLKGARGDNEAPVLFCPLLLLAAALVEVVL